PTVKFSPERLPSFFCLPLANPVKRPTIIPGPWEGPSNEDFPPCPRNCSPLFPCLCPGGPPARGSADSGRALRERPSHGRSARKSGFGRFPDRLFADPGDRRDGGEHHLEQQAGREREA